jgi:hypothetical protein
MKKHIDKQSDIMISVDFIINFVLFQSCKFFDSLKSDYDHGFSGFRLSGFHFPDFDYLDFDIMYF